MSPNTELRPHDVFADLKDDLLFVEKMCVKMTDYSDELRIEFWKRGKSGWSTAIRRALAAEEELRQLKEKKQ